MTMIISAALLDEQGMFLRMDELASADLLTPQHLPQIRECDLPPGRYLWVPDERTHKDGTLINEYGGAFWELDWLRKVDVDRARAREVSAMQNRLPPVFRNEELTRLDDFLRSRGLQT